MIGKNEMVLLVRGWRDEYNQALETYGTATATYMDRVAVDKVEYYLAQMEGLLEL